MAQVSERFAFRDSDQGRARANMCSHKIGYDSSAQARLAIKKMSDRGANTSRMQVYRCPFCLKYHAGNKPQRRKKRPTP